jgi:hypothetical protein
VLGDRLCGTVCSNVLVLCAYLCAYYLSDMRNRGDTEWIPFITEAQELAAQSHEDLLQRTRALASRSASVDLSFLSVAPPKDSTTTTATASAETQAGSTGAFEFYQLADGQRVYMSPINMQCLMHEGKALPATVTAPLLEVSIISRSSAILAMIPEHSCIIPRLHRILTVTD